MLVRRPRHSDTGYSQVDKLRPDEVAVRPVEEV